MKCHFCDRVFVDEKEFKDHCKQIHFFDVDRFNAKIDAHQIV